MVGTVQAPGGIGPACRPLWPRFYSNATSKTKFLCRPRLRREAGGQRRDVNQTYFSMLACSCLHQATKRSVAAAIIRELYGASTRSIFCFASATALSLYGAKRETSGKAAVRHNRTQNRIGFQ